MTRAGRVAGLQRFSESIEPIIDVESDALALCILRHQASLQCEACAAAEWRCTHRNRS
jgi:hypothetical protein